MTDQLLDTFILRRTDRNDRYPQNLLQLIDVDRTAIVAHLVHHVQRQHHGDAKLHELHRQAEIALDIGRIHNVDDSIRLIVQKKVTGHDLLIGIG